MQTNNTIPILKNLINGAYVPCCFAVVNLCHFLRDQYHWDLQYSEISCFRQNSCFSIWENLQIRSSQHCFWRVCYPFWVRNGITGFHRILKSSFGNEPVHFKNKFTFRRMTFLMLPGLYWLLLPLEKRKHLFSPLSPKEYDWVEETFPPLSQVHSNYLSICCLKC